MGELVQLDRMVGKIAGAIYSDICHQFPHPPLMLVPALTFKVRKILEKIPELRPLSKEQLSVLAKDIRISIVPMLISYEIAPDIIEKITPIIETAALNGLNDIEAHIN